MTQVRVDADGTAKVGKRKIDVGRTLAGALVTVDDEGDTPSRE